MIRGPFKVYLWGDEIDSFDENYTGYEDQSGGFHAQNWDKGGLISSDFYNSKRWYRIETSNNLGVWEPLQNFQDMR
jgi:hypothetical protein